MHINAMRGEIPIMLDGITYLLRPNFEALAGIEQELSQSLFILAQKLESGEMRILEMVAIIDHCLGRRAERAFLCNALLRSGLNHTLDTIAVIMANAFCGLTRHNQSMQYNDGLQVEFMEMAKRFPDRP